MEITYRVNGQKFKFNTPSYGFDFNDDGAAEAIAEECAEDFFYNHDGWESAWKNGEKTLFEIFTSPETSVDVYVYMEMLPSFSGYKES